MLCVFSRAVRFFFFSSRRRHTRWPRDWSSDVCSSDLSSGPDSAAGADGVTGADGVAGAGGSAVADGSAGTGGPGGRAPVAVLLATGLGGLGLIGMLALSLANFPLLVGGTSVAVEIGRASCRGRE